MGSGAASGSGDNNADPLINALLDKSGVSAVESVVVMIKFAAGEMFTIDAYSNDTLGVVKGKIEAMKNIPHDKQRLIFAGKPVNNDTTLSSLNLGEQATRGKTVHLTLELQGGAKKGVKKVSKDERLHLLRAKLHYQFAQMIQASPNTQILCNNVSQPHFVQTTIASMPMPQITNLNTVANECTRSDKLIKALVPLLVPDYQVLLNQKTAIENSLKAIEDAFDVGVTDAYFHGAGGVNIDPIYDAIEERLNVLTEEAAAERLRVNIEAEVARRAAAPVPEDMDL